MSCGASRTWLIAILLVLAAVALGQLTKEQPPQQGNNATPQSQTRSAPAKGAQSSGANSPATQQKNSPQSSTSGSGLAGGNGGVTNPSDPTANDLTIRGCLAQSRQGYTLRQEATDAVFNLAGDAGQFSGAAGKVVEVRGRELKPADAGALNPSSDFPRLQVSAVKVVGDECPVTPVVPNSGQGAAATPNGGRNPEPDATPKYERTNPVQTPPAVPVNPNVSGTTGAPSAGTGNPPPQKPPQQ